MSKCIRISQISVPLSHDTETVIIKACKLAGIKRQDVSDFKIVKQSVDARKKEHVFFSYVADLIISDHVRYARKNKNIQEVAQKSYAPVPSGTEELTDPIAVIGAGPAGLFAALLLAQKGYCPLVLERGKSVTERQQDVEHFWNTGILNPESNVQFGEGGAGTFSDGKLNTLVKDKFGRNRFVLETFVQFGAPEDILYVNKPHIGTDVLRLVVSNIRQEILRLGGSFRFSAKVSDFQIVDGKLTGLQINGEEWIPVSAAVLAIGHSSRDTFFKLSERGFYMEAKSFAVGMRVEHPQSMINESQYGTTADHSLLPVAAYKVTHQTASGRGVYSFCMCPGGYVVNASSEDHRLAVNGMSYRKRDSKNANSAIIVSVDPSDFGQSEKPLAGIAFQRQLEQKAWELGNGRVPQQLFSDFEQNRISSAYGTFDSCLKGQHSFANLREIFPEDINEAFVEGMHAFGRKIDGFDREDCILSAVESRTSSPVRIVRDTSFQSNVAGLYPCGEGAGYAGGITSAAMDGLKVAEALMLQYKPL